MLTPRQHITDELVAGFAEIRRSLDIAEQFPPEVLDLAAQRAATSPGSFGTHTDRRDLELCSIDPDGSMDLDQAFAIEQHNNSFVLWYAIADVGAWVRPGDAIDTEARRRGMTVYCPDKRISLHPPALSEDAASLLEGRDRPAVLWRLGIDAEGQLRDIGVERALVRNRRALSYRVVQAEIDSGSDDPQFRALVALGTVLIDAEIRRGGISLELPEQSVVPHDGHYEIRYDAAYEVESFNAQLSLTCGMAAARLMIDAGVGIVRTLPPAAPEVFDSLRLSAESLGVRWPESMPYSTWVRTLDPNTAPGAALMNLAARTLRGSGYVAFDGVVPELHTHAAINAPYSHVTAPLRRLVDRFATECALAAARGERPPAWVAEALDSLPSIMAKTGSAASKVDRAAIDLAEAAALLHRVGDTFDAMVTASRNSNSTLQLHDPAVICSIPETLPIGTHVRVRLVRASLIGPEIVVEVAEQT